jgi:integrase
VAKKSERISMTVRDLAAVRWGEVRRPFWSLENDCWGLEFVPGRVSQLATGEQHREAHHWFYVVRPDRRSGKRRRMIGDDGAFLEWPRHKPTEVRPLSAHWIASVRSKGLEKTANNPSPHQPTTRHLSIDDEIRDITVDAALAYYLNELTSNHARPRTIAGIRNTWDRYDCLRSIKDRKLWILTRDDVKGLHRTLYNEIRLRQAERHNLRIKKLIAAKQLPRSTPIVTPETLPIECGGRVSDHAVQMLREIINAQRLRIDSEDRRPPNVTRVMSEGKGLWNSQKLGVNEDEPRPLTERELVRLVQRLNAWTGNPVHRAAVLLALAGGFRRERAATIEWAWVRLDSIAFPRHTSKGRKKLFKFPITVQMRELLDFCRTFSGIQFVTPQRLRRGDTIEKPLNNFDWSEDALRGIEDRGARPITAHNLRDTVSTRLMELTNGNLLASLCVLDQQSRLKQLLAVGVRYTDMEAQMRGWVSLWHDFLAKHGLMFGALPAHPTVHGPLKRVA